MKKVLFIMVLFMISLSLVTPRDNKSTVAISKGDQIVLDFGDVDGPPINGITIV